MAVFLFFTLQYAWKVIVYIMDVNVRRPLIEKNKGDRISVGCVTPACQPYVFRWPPLDLKRGVRSSSEKVWTGDYQMSVAGGVGIQVWCLMWGGCRCPGLISGEMGEGAYPTMWPIPRCMWITYSFPPSPLTDRHLWNITFPQLHLRAVMSTDALANQIKPIWTKRKWIRKRIQGLH